MLFLHRAEVVKSPEGTPVRSAAKCDEFLFIFDRAPKQESKDALFVQIFHVHIMVDRNLPAAAAVEGTVSSSAVKFI